MSHSADRMVGRVSALAALDLSGADALGFGQRIFANDVAAPGVGDWQWNCMLSPQGRVLALFRLWRRTDEGMTLVLPAFARDATRTLLKRYLLRAKLALTDDDSVLIGGNSTSMEPDGIAMRSSDGRWLALAAANDPRLADCSDLSECWRAQDLACGVPWLEPDAVETFTPQALSLDRLAAFSVRKGCYPGQEIVARMHFLGQNKRELRRIEGSQSMAIGASLYGAGAPQRVLGSVVMTTAGSDRIEVLAVVQRAAHDQPLFADAAGKFPLRALEFDDPPLASGSIPLAKA